MKRLLLFLSLWLSLFCLPAHASNYYWDMFNGANNYNRGKFEKAALDYELALKARPEDQTALYNLGTTQMRMKKPEQARINLSKASEQGNKNLRAKAEYNLGNVAFESQKLEEALTHYINTLEINPQDMDAKYNIQIIRELLKKQKQNKKNQQPKQNQQKSSNKNQKQKKSDKNQNQPNKQQQKKQGQQKQKQPEQPRENKPEMSKEEAERILRYFNQKEKTNQARQQTRIRMQPRTEEDW